MPKPMAKRTTAQIARAMNKRKKELKSARKALRRATLDGDLTSATKAFARMSRKTEAISEGRAIRRARKSKNSPPRTQYP